MRFEKGPRFNSPVSMTPMIVSDPLEDVLESEVGFESILTSV